MAIASTIGIVLILPIVPHPAFAAVIIKEYPVPTLNSYPEWITRGPDGNLWFTEYGVGKIGKMTSPGVFNEYTVPGAPGSSLVSISAGSDGNLWFTNGMTNNVGKITTTGAITEYPVPNTNTSSASAYIITSGPDGNLWFTVLNYNFIAKITTNGTITEYPMATNTWPNAITSGPDGNLWMTEALTALGCICDIGKVATNAVVTNYPVASAPGEIITTGPDGNLWYTNPNGNSIGEVTTNGASSQYFVPTAGSSPEGIASGSDGNLWFTEPGSNQIGQINHSGLITEYSVPTTGSNPLTITSGSDGNLWFTESAANKIGEVVLHPAPPDFSISCSSLTLVVGSTGSSSCTLKSANLFAGNVTVSAFDDFQILLVNGSLHPPARSVTLSPGGTANVTLNVAAGTFPFSYPVVVIASTSSGATRTFILETIVNPVGGPNFPDYRVGGNVTTGLIITHGGSGSYNITLTPFNGFAGTVNLGATGGLSMSFAGGTTLPNVGTFLSLNSPYKAILTVSTAATTLPGTYIAVVQLTGGISQPVIQHTAVLSVIVV